MRMTLESRKRLHRGFWYFLEMHPENEKESWPGWEFNHMNSDFSELSTYVHAGCFLCDEVKGKCKWCAIRWGADDLFCYMMEGAYQKWMDEEKTELRAYYAKKIRLSPWWDEIEEKHPLRDSRDMSKIFPGNYPATNISQLPTQ